MLQLRSGSYFVKDNANCEMMRDWLYIVYRVVEDSVQHM